MAPVLFLDSHFADILFDSEFERLAV